MSRIANRDEFPHGTPVAWTTTRGEVRTGTVVSNRNEYAAQIEDHPRRPHVFIGWEFVRHRDMP